MLEKYLYHRIEVFEPTKTICATGWRWARKSDGFSITDYEEWNNNIEKKEMLDDYMELL